MSSYDDPTSTGAALIYTAEEKKAAKSKYTSYTGAVVLGGIVAACSAAGLIANLANPSASALDSTNPASALGALKKIKVSTESFNNEQLQSTENLTPGQLEYVKKFNARVVSATKEQSKSIDIFNSSVKSLDDAGKRAKTIKMVITIVMVAILVISAALTLYSWSERSSAKKKLAVIKDIEGGGGGQRSSSSAQYEEE